MEHIFDLPAIYRTPVRKLQTVTLTPALYWVGMVLIVCIAFVVRVWDLDDTALWTDEVLTVLRVQEPLSVSLASIRDADNQLPFYYMLLRLLPGDSPLWLQMTSVVFGLATIVLAGHMIAHLYSDRLLGLQVSALLSLHPMYMILSRMARFYTLLMLLALIATFCFILILRGQHSRRIWAVFLVSSMAAYITHYTALALPVIQFITLVFFKGNRSLLWRWARVQIIAVMPLMIWVVATFEVGEGGGYPYYVQTLSFRDLLISFLNVLMGYDGAQQWYLVPGLAVATTGALAGIAYGLREARARAELAYWVMLAVLPVIVFFVMAVMMNMQYRDRYFSLSIPALLLVLLWGLRRYPVWVWQTAFVLILGTSAYLSADLIYSGTYQRTDWWNVGDYLDSHYQPGDKIVFDRDLTFRTFKLHYQGQAAVLENSVLHSDEYATAALDYTASRVWVVYRIRHEDLHRQGWTEDRNPFHPFLSPFSDWLTAQRDQIVGMETFDGVTVYLLNLPRESPKWIFTR